MKLSSSVTTIPQTKQFSVSWDGAPGGSSDWIAVVPKGLKLNDSNWNQGVYFYTHGLPAGTGLTSIPLHNVVDGKLSSELGETDIVYLKDDGYVEAGRAAGPTIAPFAPTITLTSDKASVPAGGNFQLSWSTSEAANLMDSVAIVPAGADPTWLGLWNAQDPRPGRASAWLPTRNALSGKGVITVPPNFPKGKADILYLAWSTPIASYLVALKRVSGALTIT